MDRLGNAEGVDVEHGQAIVSGRHRAGTDPDDELARNPRLAESTVHNAAIVQRQRRRLPRPALITAALVAAIIGGFIVLLGPGTSATDGTRTEPGRTSGLNPFMPAVGYDLSGVTPPPGSGGNLTGDSLGLYGGILNNSTCDHQEMIKFLEAHPDKGTAWAHVQGISQADLPTYLSGLTPVLLSSDTAVTNHGFVDGQATTRHSVLQAGTTVLIDKYGVPRARCSSGNPLTPASPPATTRYVGPTWSGFSPAAITTIRPAAAEVAEFTLVSPRTGEIIYRPVGTTGDQDRPRTPPSSTTEPPPPPAPATAPERPAVAQPVKPVKPVRSAQPAQPVQPAQPAQNMQPAHTMQTAQPVQPVRPAQPVRPEPSPPKIMRVDTYRKEELIYPRLPLKDTNGGTEGFEFRGVKGSSQGKKPHPLPNPPHGRIFPRKVEYPFNQGCGTGSEYAPDVTAWVHGSTGPQSKPVIVHLSCSSPDADEDGTADRPHGGAEQPPPAPDEPQQGR